MPIKLEGSCRCGVVHFNVQSSTPAPYQLCTCSICRKVGGVGGSINLGAHANTLEITRGKEHIGIYKAVMNRDTKEEAIASSERNFCTKCSAMLWLYDENWPDLLHPFASTIDSLELEAPDEMIVIMIDSKPDYAYKQYRTDSIEAWHKKHRKYIE
ncbi:hypothetical protein HYDPIDRAFT_183723 [Hydnomerulius pinastri MD-312]|uniref:Unplaced genomic scaffold scaffold_41, whole genome shotgun sequence n=1 Tax=Hydnomerulius pinastri MD-312 TaxID=994086 RepID=A0A0C9WA32_9AGAM|nr:hypothetical protein HYDPIDRAFT_183723 [Hydnomerulius pinastri MD-312]